MKQGVILKFMEHLFRIEGWDQASLSWRFRDMSVFDMSTV